MVVDKDLMHDCLNHLYTMRQSYEDMPLVEICIQLVALDETIEKLEKQLENYEQD